MCGDKLVTRALVRRDRCVEGRQSGHMGKEREGRGATQSGVKDHGRPQKLTQAGGGEGLPGSLWGHQPRCP